MYRGAAENGVGLLAWEAAVGGVGLLARACRLFIKMGEKEKEVREAENQVAFEAGAGVSGHASFGQATAVRSKKRKEPTQSSAIGGGKAKVMLRRKPTGNLMRGEKELKERKCLILKKPLPEKLMHSE